MEQVYRGSHEYGFLKDTDTVRDLWIWFGRNRSSRFLLLISIMVVGVVTMRDTGDKSPHTIWTKL